MHPWIARELAGQRGRELRDWARQASVARAVSRRHRAVRRGADLPDETDGFVSPVIPDYVDGMFVTVSSADDKAASQAGRVPASRRAA